MNDSIKNLRVPVCPHCSWAMLYEDWHVAIPDGDVTEPVECPSCEKLFKVEAVVRWTSTPIESKVKAKALTKFEVTAVYSTRYWAEVEAADEDEAVAIARGYGVGDDSFWEECTESEYFDVDDVEEIGDK